jgi:hypothetical protein
LIAETDSDDAFAHNHEHVKKLKRESLKERLDGDMQVELKALLKQFMDENAKLKMSLTDYKNEILTLNNERETLLEQIKKLDDKLSEKEGLPLP